MKYTQLSHVRQQRQVRRRPQSHRKYRQHGIALAIALILLGVLMVFTSLAATLMTSEARLSAAQYNNARTFNAGMASLELMTDKINTLFTSNFNPSAAEIAEQAEAIPIFRDGSTDLYTFNQKVTQLGGGRALVTVLDPPFEGLTARERLFRLEAIAQDNRYQTQVRLIRDVANYQIPIFQFAVFGFDSLDVSPGPNLWLGGRTHSNRNLFLLRRNAGTIASFYGKITTVGEVVTEMLPSGQGPANGGEGVAGRHQVYDPATLGLRPIQPSVQNGTGPDDPAVATGYDYNLTDDPTSPDGGVRTSGAAPTGLVVTGIPRLLLPTESQGFQAIEILRRGIPSDDLPENEALRTTRFFNGVFARYSTIRVLIDDDIEEFPQAINTEPRAYDLNELAAPNHPFWVTTDRHVHVFNPGVGDDHPDRAVGTQVVGSGAVINGATVLPPQTNVINYQPEFQRNQAGTGFTPDRKRTYIKIELLVNDQSPNPPSRLDITQEILNMGITAGPIPVVTPVFTPVELAGNNDSFSPDGRLRASTTYVSSYPLNDTRLTTTTTDTTIENMLPWLENSTASNANIGRYKGSFGGTFPGKTVAIARTGAENATISYRFEPNAILRLQRTYFPYEPTNGIDMTTADVPAMSDAPTPLAALNPGSGRVNGYPAKFKSLIAKPYFRFTDEFQNDTYIKSNTKLNNGMFALANPFSMEAFTTPVANINKLYLGNGIVGNGTDTRFIRAIEVYTANMQNTYPGQPSSGRSELTTNVLPAYGGLLPYDNNYAQEPGSASLLTGARIRRQELFSTLSNLWSGIPVTGSNATEAADIQRKIAKYIRETIFKPGIPGFYSLGWNSATGANVIGDNIIDLDVDYEYPNQADSPNRGNISGVIDLQEMTAFPNVDPSTNPGQLQLNRFRTKTDLTENDFPHLSWPNNTISANPNGNDLPSYLKEDLIAGNNSFDSSKGFGAFRDSLKPVEAGMTNPGTAEIPRENLVFDWNGDGLIEPPHRPFQGVTPSRTSTILEGVAIGYSVESNICSLIPSTLSVSPSPNAANTRTTSIPVEVWFVEGDGSVGFPAAPASNVANEFNKTGGLKQTYPDGVPFSGQTNPYPGAPSLNFSSVNSFVIMVPFGTFNVTRQVTRTAAPTYTALVRVRSAVRVVFQHPLAPRGINALSSPVNVGFPDITATNQNGDLRQIGRNLGLTDAHYSFPGHCYMDFLSETTNDEQPLGGGPAIWLPRVRTKTDTAFPINIYDQREGRHVSRNYGFQGIPTAADYYSSDVGAGAQRIVENQWPDWPATGTVADDDRILYNLGQQLPMPSPVALERRGVLSVVELDMANLKKFFRGDFDDYLDAIPGGLSSGQPLPHPLGEPATNWGGQGSIDISDNGLIVYVSDRRGDDNNDGIYEFNDVFGENGVLDDLDNTTNTVRDESSDQKGKPGDDLLRRDVDVETQPATIPVDNAPARTGEAPHGSVPVNDGFEYFCGNINTTTSRALNRGELPTTYTTLLDGVGIQRTMLGVSPTVGGAPAPTQTGAINWRIVDNAKTGRIRAFRRSVRIVNGWDIPRWYLNQDGPVPRHFTGMSLVSENPVYIHGNLNAIGVLEQPSTVFDQESQIPGNVGAPTSSRRFLQTGNRFISRVPGNFNSNPPASGGNDDALLHGPMSIMSDAVSIHSRAFSDARMFMCPRGIDWRPQGRLRRIPMETTVKSAWLTGQPKAGFQTTSQNTIDSNGDGVDLNSGDSPNTQGGVHNFPRFCENWGGIRFNYNGSFIHQFYSHQGNGPWLINGPGGTSNYNAPNRNWNFDQAFRKLGGLPPGTPRVSFYKIRGFRQVFIEDQD